MVRRVEVGGVRGLEKTRKEDGERTTRAREERDEPGIQHQAKLARNRSEVDCGLES